MGRKQQISHLIPKNHFCSLSMFREEPLINWTFTRSVLFTAYDVYRSNDFWLDSVISSGVTLKEALVELGFPKTNTIIADTGIFEMEAKRAGIARNLGIHVDIELSNDQIFEAYELSGADYFVSPDVIVLPTDQPDTIHNKINTMMSNLNDLLERVSPTKVIAVIQGHQQSIIDNQLDFYRENDVRCYAMGGVIPLYHHDKKLLEKTLEYVRGETRDDWLHVFGLPRIGLLSYYLRDMGFDSVDTSMLLYMSARRKYMEGLNPITVKDATFEKCGCPGCTELVALKHAAQSSEFFVNLYIHNIITAARESLRLSNGSSKLQEVPLKVYPENARSISNIDENPISGTYELEWMRADETMSENRE
ncbi:MAG: hypothetical protein ACFFF9_05125 [Candidatus Thorarchaeota archaeon]